MQCPAAVPRDTPLTGPSKASSSADTPAVATPAARRGPAREYLRRVVALADYLDLTTGDAQAQFRMLERCPVPQGRQVTFLPVETLLCLAASFVVNHRHFGGGTAYQAPEPVPSLARLFSRPPSSVLAKMANLDGSRSHGARWDVLAGAMLRNDTARFSEIYRLLLHAARAEGRMPSSRCGL